MTNSERCIIGMVGEKERERERVRDLHVVVLMMMMMMIGDKSKPKFLLKSYFSRRAIFFSIAAFFFLGIIMIIIMIIITSDISYEKMWTWLRKGNLKRETQCLLRAAQNNAIRTNHTKARIDKTQQNSRGKLCSDR